MNLIIFGPPGSGKGTYATKLQAELSITAIAMGDVFRDAIKQGTALGKKVENYLKSGQLVPDDVVIEVLKDKIRQGEGQTGFILDGFRERFCRLRPWKKFRK